MNVQEEASLKIVGRYGKEAIQIEKNRIIVTIPFDKIGVNSFVVSNKVSNKVSDKLNKTKLKMIELIRDNPNITINQFSIMLKLSEGDSICQLKGNVINRNIFISCDKNSPIDHG